MVKTLLTSDQMKTHLSDPFIVQAHAWIHTYQQILPQGLLQYIHKLEIELVKAREEAGRKTDLTAQAFLKKVEDASMSAYGAVLDQLPKTLIEVVAIESLPSDDGNC